MDKKGTVTKGDITCFSKEKIELKKRKYLSSPFIRMMSEGPHRDIIQSFAGVWCCYPIQYVMMEVLTKDSKFLLATMLRGVSGSWEEMGKVPAVETIGLYRWYEWMLSFCVKVHISHIVNRRSVSPYNPLNTLEDINWYFSGDYGYADRYGCPGPWCKDDERNGYIDMIVLKEHLGEIKMDDVRVNKLNAIRPIIGGRWDIADKYIERGDVEDYTDFYKELKGPQMEELLRRYDMHHKFTASRIGSDKKLIAILMRGGIFHISAVMNSQTLDIAEEIGVSLSSLPMNVVEDLFTVSAITYAHSSRGDGDVGIWKDFFDNLCMKGKPTSPSSIHRIYKNENVDAIILEVRKGNRENAMKLIGDLRRLKSW